MGNETDVVFLLTGARGPDHRRGVRGGRENRGGDEFSERDANAAGRRTVRLF